MAVLNLTPEPLPTGKAVLLRRGLSFIPTKHSTPAAAHLIADQAINRMSKNMRWTEHFGGEPPPSDINTRLILPSVAEVPAGSILLKKFNYDVRTDIHSEIDRAHKIKWNYRRRDLDDLHNLSFTDGNEVLPADKNLGPVYIPRSWRYNESMRQLSDPTTYALCSSAQKTAVCRRLTSFIKNNKEVFPLSQKEYDGLLSKTQSAILNDKWPTFKCLPKIHKLEVCDASTLDLLKGRPIISAHSCASSYLSIFVDSFLAPFAWSADNVLNDSKQLVRELNSFPATADMKIATADVTSLYPNIPTTWGCRVVKGYLLNHGVDMPTANLVHAALTLVLTSNVFTFDGIFRIQLKGTAMGTHCAPTYATLVLVIVEQNSKISWAGILLFRRYIDDLFVVARSLIAITEFLVQYQSVRDDFRLTSESGTTVDFMNLTVSAPEQAGLIQVAPYAKKFNKFLYLPFMSHHPIHMKKAFCKSLITSLIINSSSFKIFLSELSVCYDRLRARGYPLSLLKPIFSSISYADRRKMLAPKAPATPESTTVLNLPFDSIFCRIPIGKIVHKHFDNTLAHYFTVLKKPIVSWSRTHNVGDIINITRTRVERAKQDPDLP